MGWRDLLQKDELLLYPWVGGRTIQRGGQIWSIKGQLPEEPGWHTFKLVHRTAFLGTKEDDELARPYDEIPPGPLQDEVKGYLVGDRFIRDDATVDPNPRKIIENSERIHLVEDGLDKFVRVEAGRFYEGGPLIYAGMDMPLGPEEAVLSAFLDEKPTVDDIPHVTTALDAAFRMETFQRAEAERRRQELERLRREEEERRALEERRQKLIEQLGDGAGRREMARTDFAEAAKAALAISGATFLDHRKAPRQNEMIVRFRFLNRRFECVCSTDLRIIDAGICLTAHYDDEEFEEGTKGDTFFTLESLPSVIREADRDGKLVVFRHA